MRNGQNRNLVKKVGTLVVLGVLVASLIGCSSTPTYEPDEQSTASLAQEINDAVNGLFDSIEKSLEGKEIDYAPYLVQVETPKIVHKEYSDYIVGSYKNTSTVTFDYVEVTFAVYDKAGNQIDTDNAVITDLLPGNTWKYEEYLFVDNAYKVEVIKVDVRVYSSD